MFDWEFVFSHAYLFKDALLLTLQISAVGILLSFIIGFVCALLLSFKKIFFLSMCAGIYTEIARNTPLVLQIFFLYFGLNRIGLELSAFWCASFGVITGFNYYYLGYKPIFSHLYMVKENYDAHIQSFIKTHTLYTIIAFNFFILAFYLGILVYLISAKCLRRLFIGISYVVVTCILLVSPKILIPAMGIFTDKRALLDPLSTLGGIYTICFGFVLFSFIKTIRKNSIVPN